MNPALRRLRQIGLCLLAAILLHSLVLALLQLQRQRLGSTTASSLSPAKTADDTPELLRFSRHQAESGTPSIVPLPGLDQLPLPPPPMAGAVPRPSGNAKSKPQADLKPHQAGAAGTNGSRTKPLAEHHPNGSPAHHGNTVNGRPSGPAAEAETPAALLERLRRLAVETSETRPGAEANPANTTPGRGEARRGGDASGRGAAGMEPPPPLLLRPEGSAQQPYQALWESARPETGGPAGSAALPLSLERRSLPLAQARRGGLPFSHGEGVLLGDQLMLFWVQGDQLWLLRSKMSS